MINETATSFASSKLIAQASLQGQIMASLTTQNNSFYVLLFTFLRRYEKYLICSCNSTKLLFWILLTIMSRGVSVVSPLTCGGPYMPKQTQFEKSKKSQFFYTSWPNNCIFLGVTFHLVPFTSIFPTITNSVQNFISHNNTAFNLKLSKLGNKLSD